MAFEIISDFPYQAMLGWERSLWVTRNSSQLLLINKQKTYTAVLSP
jgi:hypothetical protein